MGSAIVPSGQTIQLRVRATGIDDGEQATFEIFKLPEKESLATVNGKVVDGFATAEWESKGPKEDEDVQEWKLEFTVKCKGLETQAAPLIVYTDWCELKCVDREGKALEGVLAQVRVSQTIRPGQTDGGGLFKAEELPYGPVEASVEPPFEIMEMVSEKSPKLEARVRKALPGKLLFPLAGQHKQYVNLDPDEPEQGSKLTLKATLEGGKAGDLIFFKVEWGEENSERSDPKPELLGGAEEEWCPQGGKQLTLSEDEGEVELELELGLAGGDVVHVYVSGTEEFRKDLTEVVTVVNWRRIYYQITRLADSTPPEMGLAKQALAEVFVEYEQTSEVTLTIHDDLPPGALIEGSEVGELGRSGTLLNIGEHDVSWWHDKFKGEKSPREAHLILADALYDCGPGGKPVELTLEEVAQHSGKTVRLSGDDEKYTLFSKSLVDGESSIRPGSSWESLAPPGHPLHGKQGEITGDHAKFRSLYGDQVFIELPSEAKEVIAAEHTVKLVLHLHLACGPYGGMTDGLHQVLTTTFPLKAFNGNVVHELGHAIEMCLDEVPPGLSPDDHGRQYTGRGHQGPHCAHGVNESEWEAGQDFRSGDGMCVMWGSGYAESSTPVTFCKLCTPFTRAQALQELKQSE